MRLLHLIPLAMMCSVLVACASAAAPPESDLYAPYRPALLAAYQKDLDNLPPISRYNLDLKVDFDTRHVEGQGTVQIPNRHAIPLTELYFRLFPNLPQYQGTMVVNQIFVDGKMTAFDITADNTSLHILLPEPLSPDHTAAISYTWTVNAPSLTTGYALFGEGQGILSLPLSYPIVAVSEVGTTGQRLNWRLDVAPAHGDVAFT
jgi:hypothetical protein